MQLQVDKTPNPDVQLQVDKTVKTPDPGVQLLVDKTPDPDVQVQVDKTPVGQDSRSTCVAVGSGGAEPWHQRLDQRFLNDSHIAVNDIHIAY